MTEVSQICSGREASNLIFLFWGTASRERRRNQGGSQKELCILQTYLHHRCFSSHNNLRGKAQFFLLLISSFFFYYFDLVYSSNQWASSNMWDHWMLKYIIFATRSRVLQSVTALCSSRLKVFCIVAALSKPSMLCSLKSPIFAIYCNERLAVLLK